MSEFDLVSTYEPTGDQPAAIAGLVAGIEQGVHQQTLLGATGTGKTFAVANVIQQTQRPTLVLAHNKTLAAQLYSEFKRFFPQNAVSYFVSYYDYYQPEAYVPRSDTYIEKTTAINAEIEMMRLAATQALATRRDVIIVASVSAIYSLGDPARYDQARVSFRQGEVKQRNKTLRQLIGIHYERNDVDFKIGSFRVRGDVLEIRPSYTESAYRVEFWGEEVERITQIDPLTGELLGDMAELLVHPARHFVTGEDDIGVASVSIEKELETRLDELIANNQLLEAQRLEQRTLYDLEMLRELGYCSGSENYTSHFSQRPDGSPPWTLLDYFPDDFLMVVDESHMTIPQIKAMYRGDRHRKQVLVDYGFRLPSALNNRPLTFDEWEERAFQLIYTSATPGPYEQEHSQHVVQQIIRPTGLLDPQVSVRPVLGQIDDLLAEVKVRARRGERTLITTLTKRMAEDLADYLQQMGVSVHYLHSELDTFERVDILQQLRAGHYDAVVGINLLREGLDLPEVSLVAILDADKEGFLRSETALIQTIGRAARHESGQVIMYAERLTDSMRRALDETERRRGVQAAYNRKHAIIPQTIQKAQGAMLPPSKKEMAAQTTVVESTAVTSVAEMVERIEALESQMQQAAQALEFERAAALRDELRILKRDGVLASEPKEMAIAV